MPCDMFHSYVHGSCMHSYIAIVIALHIVDMHPKKSKILNVMLELLEHIYV